MPYSSDTPGSQPSARPNGGGEAPDPFDLENVKARPEDYGTVRTQRPPDEIMIGRPDPQEFIRVHPEHHIDLPLVIDRAKDQYTLVMPNAKALLADDIRICTTFLYVTTEGKPGLWPIPLSDNAWHESAFEAAREAQHSWLRVIPKPGKNGHYVTKKAIGPMDPAKWPTMEFGSFIETAFVPTAVWDASHRLVKRLAR